MNDRNKAAQAAVEVAELIGNALDGTAPPGFSAMCALPGKLRLLHEDRDARLVCVKLIAGQVARNDPAMAGVIMDMLAEQVGG